MDPKSIPAASDSHEQGMAALRMWWAMHEAQWETFENTPADDAVILSFMGSGASTLVTAGQLRAALS